MFRLRKRTIRPAQAPPVSLCSTCTIGSCGTTKVVKGLPRIIQEKLDGLVEAIMSFNSACNAISKNRNAQAELEFKRSFEAAQARIADIDALKEEYPQLEQAATLAINNHANELAKKVLLQ